MTVRQVAEFIDAYNEAATRQFKEQAVLLSGQARQIASAVGGLLDKKNKFIPLVKLYPDLFKDAGDIPPEETQRYAAFTWRQFLQI